MSISQLLARPDGSMWIVSGYAFDDEPVIRLLAYRVNADPSDAPARVSVGWTYTGPREATYRRATGTTGRIVFDPSAPADMTATIALPQHFPGIRREVEYRNAEFHAIAKNGARTLVLRVTEEYVAGVIAGAFASAPLVPLDGRNIPTTAPIV